MTENAEKIFDAERHAEQIIADARKKAAEILDRAGVSAGKMYDDEIKKTSEYCRKIESDAAKKAQDMLSEAENTGKKKGDEVKKTLSPMFAAAEDTVGRILFE